MDSRINDIRARVSTMRTTSFASPLGVAAKAVLRQKKSLLALILCGGLLLQTSVPAKACGPETIEPIFVFKNSPDLPFEEFAKGNIGILQSSLGRKSLVIAHRYLSGGTFTKDEERALVEALRGQAPEDDDHSAIKAWIAARKEIIGDEKEPLAIYDERRQDGYDFFPNCTKNAFEVATQTLRDRVASYGATDLNVREWLHGQDVVFENCTEGNDAPVALGAESPQWLQKDRNYQVAAACFYSLKFNEARNRFQKIAEDPDSVWQETAAYLVGRTLVRQASLTDNASEKRELFEQAEVYLINLSAHGGSFESATKRLLGLVEYRLHPEQRLRELAQILSQQYGNENLRQDLIDYTWLLDKFDAQIQKQEEERKQSLNPSPPTSPSYQPDPVFMAKQQAVDRGELVEVYFTPRDAAGELDYTKSMSFYLKPDATEADGLQQAEINLGRKLTPDEANELGERYASALSRRQWLISPNRKFDRAGSYEGCDYNCNELTLQMLPEFIRTDELSDWIMTFQSKDPKAYAHSVSRWRATQSPAWLAVALTKSHPAARGLVNILRDAEGVESSSPAYPTIAYHLVRLKLEQRRLVEARELLDKVFATQFDLMPVSSQNLFLEQRLEMAGSVDEFLKFATRKPVAFYQYGTIGHLSDLLGVEKELYDPSYMHETKEEYDQKTESKFRELLLWDDRKIFDQHTADIFNWHFSLKVLLAASRSQQLPEYLHRRLSLVLWTRAVLLKNDVIARQAATDLTHLAPELEPVLLTYLNAQTREQRDSEALYILLKFPGLSPYIESGIPELTTAEDAEYYFETSWWCKPDDTEYKIDGTEAPKIVENPRWLGPPALAEAQKEREALKVIGDAKSFLGKRVIEWAIRTPRDPRIPEALYIAVQANQNYKYGCGGWEQDEETRTTLETLLKERYPDSSWAAKLDDNDGP